MKKSPLKRNKPLRSYTPLKSKTPLKQRSEKMERQVVLERIVKRKLYQKQNGFCADCGRYLSFSEFQKHEELFRSQGGDPTDITITKGLCLFCHKKPHRIKVVDSKPEWSGFNYKEYFEGLIK